MWSRIACDLVYRPRSSPLGALGIAAQLVTEAQRSDCPVRDRSGDNAPDKAELLSLIEIRAAAARVIAESGEMPREDLIVATARLMGFAKTGRELRDRIDRAIPRTDP